MDIQKIFHMKGGLGDTSYSVNSRLQKRDADMVKDITTDAIAQMYIATQPTSIGIADLGCSSGPNTLSNVKELVRAVERASTSINQTAPEFRVYLNDLPTNDFNTIFQALPDWHMELKQGRNDGSGSPPIYIAGCPGTFYGRLFPDHSLHFIYSSHSLHWLSRVPPGINDEKGASMNKKSLYITERSPPQVSRAYTLQFQEDLAVFLKSRSKEVVTGGRMVLMMLGRRGWSHVDRDTTILWELLYQSLADFAIQGEFDEERVDEYDVHFYAPAKEELEDEIRKEGSFKVEVAETLEMDHKLDSIGGSYASYGSVVAKTVRSVQESMIAHHFGVGEAVLDKLFQHYGRLIDEQLTKYDDTVKSISTIIVLTKL